MRILPLTIHGLICVSMTASALAQAPAARPANQAPAQVQSAAAPALQNPGNSPDLQQTYAEGMAAFQAGDYQTSASKFDSLLDSAPPGAPLESVYYTLGASLFNLEKYPRAVETFTKYLSLYPNGAQVLEANFSIAQAAFQTKDYLGAAAKFKPFEQVPQFRSQALLYEGNSFKEAGKTDEAIKSLEKLVFPQIDSNDAATGAVLLTSLYSANKQPEKALALIGKLRQNMAKLDNVAQLNALSIALGDSFFKEKQYKSALACYRQLRPREEIIKIQSSRMVAIQKKIDLNILAIHADPRRVGQLMIVNNSLKASLVEERKQLEELPKLPDLEPAVTFRVATSFYQLEKKWESIVAYEEFLKRFPADPAREAALFGLVVASAESNRTGKVQALCKQYLGEFKNGPNAPTVGFLMGASALQSNDLKSAESFFGSALSEQPGSNFREEMRFLLGNSRFGQGKFDDALKDYQAYATEFPQGGHQEEVSYRIGLCSIFAGRYEDAMGHFAEYLKKYPRGTFAADVRYRNTICKFAASLFDEVVGDCKAWEVEFGSSSSLLAEVLALRADALESLDRKDQAIECYIRSYKCAGTEALMNTSLFDAQKLLVNKGDWKKLGEMFEEFVKDKPESPSVVSAVYWIAKAKVHEGKADEAKQYLAKTIKLHIADPKSDAVDELLTQLAQLCAKKKRPPSAAPAPPADAAKLAESGSLATATSSAASIPDASPLSAPTPTPAPAVDPAVELAALLGGSATDQSPTARARALYAKAQLARLRRQVPEAEKALQEIADRFKPEDLSPTLIAEVGDYLVSKGQVDKAAPIFQRLLDQYPKSDVIDFAYNGLGEAAFQKRDYPAALKWFTEAIEKVGASNKLMEVTVGKAKTQLAMGQLDEAKKGFEQIAATREWRGEATAFSVYSLGEIAMQKKDLPAAIAYYQRVFVAYRRFLPWVAKAYVKSAECFEQLGKKTEACNTYREMLRNPKLEPFSECEIAKKRLQELGNG